MNRRSLLQWATIGAPLSVLGTRLQSLFQAAEPPVERAVMLVAAPGRRSVFLGAVNQVTGILGKVNQGGGWADLPGEMYNLTGTYPNLSLVISENAASWFERVHVFYR